MLVIKDEEKGTAELAAEFLKQGKVIAFATDTVYGLAVDASNYKAVNSLYKVKNRKQENPIAIFVKDLTSAKKIFYFNRLAEQIAKDHLSGGLTMVLKTRKKASSLLASNLNRNNDGFLGFRVVKSAFLQKLFKEFKGILAVTSANPSGQKAAVSAKEVAKYFSKNKSIALLIDGGTSKQKKASTVIKISGKEITVLRQGLIKISEYENF